MCACCVLECMFVRGLRRSSHADDVACVRVALEHDAPLQMSYVRCMHVLE